MRFSHSLLALPLLLAGCARQAPPPQAVEQSPAPAVPAAVVVVAPTPTDWRDAPETPGAWSYVVEGSSSAARYGRGGVAEFELRCDVAAHQVRLSRLGGTAGPMMIKTSYGERSWPAQALDGRTAISLTATDPFLDQLAFSRGRFSVALGELPLLMLPAWAEPARVIEDCRR